MVQSKVNRELATLGVSITDINMNDPYATQSKSKTNSSLYGFGENNLLPLQTLNSNKK